MSMEKPPNFSGVGTVSDSGKAGKQVANLKTARVTKRNPSRGQDPLRPDLLQEAKKVIGNTPNGVQPLTNVDIVEQKLFKDRKRNSKMLLHVPSVDGQVYVFRIPKDEDERNTQLPYLMFVMAIREIGLGGSPFPVLDAFKYHQKDLDDKPVYPLPETLLSMLDPESAVPEDFGSAIPGASFGVGGDESDDPEDD